MTKELSKDAVLRPTPWSVVRPQKDQFLFYNSKTDEMHLIPHTGHYAYQLCNGSRTLSEIEHVFLTFFTTQDEAASLAIHRFFGQLIDRGLLEITDV